MDEKLLKQEIRVMNRLYFGFIAIAIIFGGLFYYMHQLSGNVFNSEECTIIQSIAMLIMLAAIPFSLKLYKKKTEATAIPSEVSNEAKLVYLKQWFIIRIYILEMTSIVLFLSYYLAGSNSLLICAGITLMFLVFFCKPNEQELKEKLEESEKMENDSKA